MKKYSHVFLIGIIFFILQGVFGPLALASETSPVGVWQTIDDKTNKPRSIIEIWQQGNELRGKLIKVFYEPGESEKDRCVKCKGANFNRLILGMTILWGFTKEGDDNEWSNGRILDPKTGDIYHCKMWLSPDNQTMKVRGYIGIPLLGRTQVWLRQAD